MSAVTVCLPEDVYSVFRLITLIVYGDKKGRISHGGAEALAVWCRTKIVELELEDPQFIEFLETYFDEDGNLRGD